MEINLGRVVGSRIRVGKTVPLEFPKWLDGDIFIHNSGEIPFYEYKPESSEKLIFLGNLKGEPGKEDLVKRVWLDSSEIEDVTGSNHPDWKNVISTIELLYGSTYDEIIFVTFKNAEQTETNYLIMHKNYYNYVITNFETFTVFNKVTSEYRSYDMSYLYDKPAELYLHNIYLSADAPFIDLYLSLTTNKKEPLTIDDVVKYCAFTYGYTIPICRGTVLTSSMVGGPCWALAAMIFGVDTDTPRITVNYFNNDDKTIASISDDLIRFICEDNVIKL